MITENDREILRHIEFMRFCTAKQIAKIFYKNRSQGTNIARRRLREMVKYDYLRTVTLDTKYSSKGFIFKSSENRNFKITRHKLLIADYYAELLYIGAQIKYFKKEQKWMDGKYISDAFCIFNFNNTTYSNLVEAVSTSYSYNTVKKYDDIYETNEIQEILLGDFPTLVIIDNVDREHVVKLKNNIKIINLNHNLDNFPKLFL